MNIINYIKTHIWTRFILTIGACWTIIELLSYFKIEPFKNEFWEFMSFTLIVFIIEEQVNKYLELTKANNNSIVLSNLRDKTYEFYKEAFETKQDLLIVSIMSQHTIKAIEPHLTKALANNKKVDVLTFDPESNEETIEAIRKHLNENSDDPSKTKEQIEQALDQWTALANKFNNLEIRKYKTIPTVQGIFVKEKFIVLEIMAYSSEPRERPGLIVEKDKDQELFIFLQDRYNKLWLDNK